MKKLSHCIIIAFLLIMVQSSYAMTVRIGSENMDITEVGETIDIEVMIEDAADVGSVQFEISYDPEILIIEDKQDVEIGGFLKNNSGTVLQLSPIIDNTAGRLTFGAISFGQTQRASGSGLLAVITFVVKDPKDTSLKLNHIKITNAKGRAISVNKEDEMEIIGYVYEVVDIKTYGVSETP